MAVCGGTSWGANIALPFKICTGVVRTLLGQAQFRKTYETWQRPQDKCSKNQGECLFEKKIAGSWTTGCLGGPKNRWSLKTNEYDTCSKNPGAWFGDEKSACGRLIDHGVLAGTLKSITFDTLHKMHAPNTQQHIALFYRTSWNLTFSSPNVDWHLQRCMQTHFTRQIRV